MRASSERVVAPAGALLFAEGDAGSFAYLIEKGRIEIFLNRDGGELSLVVREVGEIVGEMALIDRGMRSASARALDDCELTVITQDQISTRIANTDPILRMCLGVVIDRYRETVARLDHGTARTAPTRVVPAAASAHFVSALETLSLENDLRRAIACSELELYFQPIVHLPERRLAGYEALLRWNHPERGMVPPLSFIPIAEASGLILDITAWCIAEVGRQFPRIVAAADNNPSILEPLFLSVNISGHDLAQSSLIANLSAMIGTSGLLPGSIKLEVTESVLMTEPIKAAAVLAECRALGLKVAIDDFGTGYSSLSHLSTLPITTIKIDQSFVRSMIADATSRKIVHMILRLAGELGIPVVAEGIEGEAEAADLGALGCACGQGYLFGRPEPLATTLALTRSWSSLDGGEAVTPARERALCA